MPQSPHTVFAFPYAGGDAQAYAGWANLLDIPSWITLDLPGRGLHPALPYASAEALVEALLPRLDTGRQPCVFFGHSFGALLAFLACHALARHGRPLPCALILSGCQAPVHFAPTTPAEPSDAELLALLRAYGGTPEVILNNPALLAFFLPYLKADLTLVRRYRRGPLPSLPVPLLVLSGRQDSRHGPAAARDWHAETHAGSAFESFEGGHFFIKERRAEVLACLGRFLPQVLAGASMQP